MVNIIKYKFKQATGYVKGRAPWKIKSIILHSTDGHKEGDIATLTGTRVSVHWYVTKTGEVFHFVDNADTAWHAGVVNDLIYSNKASIGIEQEHIDGAEEWPDCQVLTTARICAALMQKYHIMQKYIRSHADIAYPRGRKVDPESYPWDKFNKYLEEALKTPWVFEELTD
jgi:AmpD protein